MSTNGYCIRNITFTAFTTTFTCSGRKLFSWQHIANCVIYLMRYPMNWTRNENKYVISKKLTTQIMISHGVVIIYNYVKYPDKSNNSDNDIKLEHWVFSMIYFIKWLMNNK